MNRQLSLVNPREKFWLQMPKAGHNGMEMFLLWLLSSWVWVLNVYLSAQSPRFSVCDSAGADGQTENFQMVLESRDSTALPDLLSWAAGRDSPALCPLPFPALHHTSLASSSVVSHTEALPSNTQRKPKLAAVPSRCPAAKPGCCSLPPPALHSPLQGEICQWQLPLPHKVSLGGHLQTLSCPSSSSEALPHQSCSHTSLCSGSQWFVPRNCTID